VKARWPNPIEWGLGVGLIAALAILAWNFDPFGRRKAAETRADTAEVQSSSDQAGQHIEAERAQVTVKIIQTSEESRRAIQDTTRLEDAWAEYLSGLGSVRNNGDTPDPDPDERRPDANR
jgi:hypothetical protein